MTPAILLKELLETDKTEHVARLIAEFVTANQERSGWRPVGDRPNNSGTIQVAGDPMRALLERVTNAIDAVIDRAHQEHHGRPHCTTPREAAQAWFAVPPEGLHRLSEIGRRQLAQSSVWVTLLPGEGKASRAVDISDKGSGLIPSRMGRTILSLNESNKLDKFHLAGAFGQGGSATFASSEYTLIASRAKDSANLIGFTIVRYEAPKGVKLGSYVYLVWDNEVLETSEVPALFGDFSTRVRHYGYDLDDYGSKIGPSSVYGRAQTVLFDPVLPFWFRTEVHGFGRTIKGVRAALNGARDTDDEDSKLAHSTPLFFTDLGEFGQIGIEYWVLEAPSERKGAPNRAFVNSAKPVVLTVNGQSHAEWSANIIRKDADLLHLAPRIIVHLNADRLSIDAKNALFVSNREESRKGQLQNLLLTELLSALRSDDRLYELNEEAKAAGLRQRDEVAEKEVRREVARMLKLFGFSTTEAIGGGAGGSREKGPSVRPPRPRPKPEPVPLADPPTILELVGDAVRLFPGQRRFIRVRTNAHSNYHSASDPAKSKFSFIVDCPRVRCVGSTELRDGHMRVIFAADPEASIGDRGEITVELRPPQSLTLSASLPIEIVAAPAPKPSSGKLSLPNIDIQPIDEIGGEEWTAWGWPESEVDVAADYSFVSDTLTIRYSSRFQRFQAVLASFETSDLEQAASFRRRYEIWLATSILIHWQDTQMDPTSIKNAALETDEIDEYRRDELRRMSKAAVVYAQREVSSPVTEEL